VFGLPTGELSDQIFPFDTEAEYVSALSRYTSSAVKNRDSINGYTADSEAAYTGFR
jgi:hypothetical protein